MKCEKWTDQHDTSVGQKKIWVSYRNRIHDELRTPDRHSSWSIIYILIQLQLPCCQWVLVAQWTEHPAGFQVMGLIPGRDSDFFFVPRWCHVDQLTFHIFLVFVTSLLVQANKKCRFQKTWQIFVVLLKECDVMQD